MIVKYGVKRMRAKGEFYGTAHPTGPPMWNLEFTCFVNGVFDWSQDDQVGWPERSRTGWQSMDAHVWHRQVPLPPITHTA